MFFKKLVFAVLVVVMSLPLVSFAQDDKIVIPLSVWSASQIDPTDNSVFYSVLMASGQEALSDVTVTAQLPEGASFVKEFWKPEAATFVGEENGLLTWTIDAVDADAVAGPFTFVASFEGSDSEEFAPPASFKAAVTSTQGTVENEVIEGTIPVLEDEGSLEITPDGMIDFAVVGETGIWVYTPEASVSAPVTLNFLRNKIDPEAALPEVAEDTWWCGFVTLSASEDVTLTQPLLMVVPLLRAATPDTVMPVFAQREGGEWQLISAEDSVSSIYGDDTFSAPAFAKVAPSGTEAYVLLNAAELGSVPLSLAIGVNTQVRVVSVQPIATTPVPSISVPKTGISGDPAPWF